MEQEFGRNRFTQFLHEVHAHATDWLWHKLCSSRARQPEAPASDECVLSRGPRCLGYSKLRSVVQSNLIPHKHQVGGTYDDLEMRMQDGLIDTTRLLGHVRRERNRSHSFVRR